MLKCWVSLNSQVELFDRCYCIFFLVLELQVSKRTFNLEKIGLFCFYVALYLFIFVLVNNIRGIHTSAAGLESTSLVLVYGLDVYFTRVMPSKMFDVLKEDFDYIFISGVLSALILGSVVCSKLASIKSLNLAWQ